MKKIDYTTYEKPSDFLRFKPGDTAIRIVSSGGMAKKHGLRTAAGYVPLGDCTERPDCKHCLQGNAPKTKWMWLAVNRTDNQVKLLDVGPMLGDAICKLAQERKQDPQEFDLIVNKVGEKLRTKYTVKVGEVKPLTPEELAGMKAAKAFLIKKYFTKDE